MTEQKLEVSGHEFPVWPEHCSPRRLDEPSVKQVRFADHADYQDVLREAVTTAYQDERFRDYLYHGACGTKVREPLQWDVGADAVHLINERALRLYRKYGGEAGVVDEFWANLYRDGDYCLPHSHVRASASVVYFLDVDEVGAANAAENNGRFYIGDPRSQACCQLEAGRMTHLLMPELRAGTMIIFPSLMVHGVTPVRGDHRRITLSWNIGPNILGGTAAEAWR